MLPKEKLQLRLEDLLGFRRNPTASGPLFQKFNAKHLDGHPTPVAPFVKLSTGASGVGVTTAVGLALGAVDIYGDNAPITNILEGECGLTPGRVAEALAAAATTQLHNAVLHIDWNQSSIDSDNVCREGEQIGDYVQWDPMELAYNQDWNVIFVPDGFDYKQVMAAQKLAFDGIDNKQPTAIVYRTTKGWKYGIEGAASHGAGHDFCSDGFYKCLEEFENIFGLKFPRFSGDRTVENMEKSYWDCLATLREALESNKAEIADKIAASVTTAKNRLADRNRTKKDSAPNLDTFYADSSITPENTPEELQLEVGSSYTLRGALGDSFSYLNKLTNGAFIGSAADLFGSTNLSNLAKGVSEGYFNSQTNADARLIKLGGICEDAIGGIMAGVSTFGNHIGVSSSYGAFVVPLQHITARLHAIGQEARKEMSGDDYNPFVIVCAHAGPKTAEDGPTHADPQALQLVSENFPKDSLITLTPMDPQEVWPLVCASLKARPAVVAAFVSRPAELVLDRSKIGIAPAEKAAQGVYALRTADPNSENYGGTLVLQGNGIAESFVRFVLPKLDEEKLEFNIYYVSSTELFDRLSEGEQEDIFPAERAEEAMGISEFTLPTLYRWVTSANGRKRSLYTFKKGHFMGSGKAHKVLEQAGLHPEGQIEAILEYAKAFQARKG